MFERFTTGARETVLRARHEAHQRHTQIGTEHLLLALLADEAGAVSQVLRGAGVEAADVHAALDRLVPGADRLGPGDAAALHSIGVDLQAVLARIEQSFGPDAVASALPPARRGLRRRRRHLRTTFGPRAKKVLELSLREAVRLRSDGIGPEHLLLGLLREGDGLAARILVDAGLDLEDLRRATLASLDGAA